MRVRGFCGSWLLQLAIGVSSWLAAPHVHAGASDVPIQRPRAVTQRTETTPAPPTVSSAAAAPMRTPAPRATTVPAPRIEPTAEEVLHAEHESTQEDERLPHRGFTIDARIGAAGCQRSLCSSAHNASPGLRIDGFIGGNIRGFVDLGVAGGWGSHRASVEQDTNLLRLYGIEPARLQTAAAAAGSPLGFNPFALQVQSARLRTARVGPSLRIHVLPRGRGLAYFGAGFGYTTFLADYDTSVGNVSLRFHGIDVPLHVGGGVQMTKHLAAIVQFDYTFNRYPVARFDHPQERLTLPVAFLDTAAQESTGNSVSEILPRSWNISAGLRARF